MGKKYCHLIFFGIFLLFVMQITYGDFDVWSEREGVFTIGRSTPFIIYIKNKGVSTDSYTITPSVEYNYPLPVDDLSHLIQVHLVSNKIENLDEGQVRDTQGTITLLGEVHEPPGGTITFTVEPDSGGSETTSIQISGSMSRVLPEFSLIGFVQLFFLIGLVIFYSFHIR